MAADHYRLPHPVGPTPGIQLGASRPSTAEAVRAMLLARARTGWWEILALTALWIAAVAIRLPHLWSVPVFNDDTEALLHALARAQAGAWFGPGATLSSVGAVHEVLFAAGFALVGPSPHLPRLITAVQAALTVPLVYLLTRELCRPLGRRRIEETFLMPRLAGLVAAGLLATSAAHVVLTSHVARAESFAPLLVIGLLFAAERALNGRNARWLIVAGALFGLAVQTSPLVLAIVPGVLVAGWLRARSFVVGAGGLAALAGVASAYAGTIATALQQRSVPWPNLHLGAASLAADAGQQPSGDLYLDSVGAALVAVWRMLAGQLTSRPPADNLLGEPLAWPFLLLALAGALVLLLRGRPLLPLVALSSLLVLPYVSADAAPLLNGRHLMTVAIVSIVAIGVAVGALAPLVTGRGSLPRLALGVVLGGLVLAPLGGLRSYYDEATPEERTADGLLRVPRAVFDERRYNEVVMLDERLGRLRLGAGGNALEALHYLLAASSVPTRTITMTARSLAAESPSGQSLIVVHRASLPAVEASIRLTLLLDDWIDAGDGLGAAMLFRAESFVPHRVLEDGSIPTYAEDGL